MRHPIKSRSGQMSVELAVVMPVILAVMLVVVDGMMYVGECARFEQAVPQAVLACAVTSGGEVYDETAANAAVAEALQSEFDAPSQSVSVEMHTSWGIATYTCTLNMAPWPLGAGDVSFFGISIPTALSHSCSCAVDPYEIGSLL